MLLKMTEWQTGVMTAQSLKKVKKKKDAVYLSFLSSDDT